MSGYKQCMDIRLRRERTTAKSQGSVATCSWILSFSFSRYIPGNIDETREPVPVHFLLLESSSCIFPSKLIYFYSHFKYTVSFDHHPLWKIIKVKDTNLFGADCSLNEDLLPWSVSSSWHLVSSLSFLIVNGLICSSNIHWALILGSNSTLGVKPTVINNISVVIALMKLTI